MIRMRMGCDETEAVTKDTNRVRTELGQGILRNDNQSEINMQAHDVGTFAQARTVYTTSNMLRELASQQRMVSSAAPADLNMHALLLHEEQQLRMAKMDSIHQEYEDEDAEPPIDVDRQKRLAELGEPPEKIFLSKVSGVENEEFDSMLSDSGASRSVYGKGRVASRLLVEYIVGFDSKTQGFVHPDSLDVKNAEKTKRKRKSIMVANGQKVEAVSAERLHFGVKARRLIGNKWSDTKETVFLAVQDAAISQDIESTVWSELLRPFSQRKSGLDSHVSWI